MRNLGCLGSINTKHLLPKTIPLLLPCIPVRHPSKQISDFYANYPTPRPATMAGTLGISLAFPPFDVGGGNLTTVFEVVYVD
jgi:hypothetical protein